MVGESPEASRHVRNKHTRQTELKKGVYWGKGEGEEREKGTDRETHTEQERERQRQKHRDLLLQKNCSWERELGKVLPFKESGYCLPCTQARRRDVGLDTLVRLARDEARFVWMLTVPFFPLE